MDHADECFGSVVARVAFRQGPGRVRVAPLASGLIAGARAPLVASRTGCSPT